MINTVTKKKIKSAIHTKTWEWIDKLYKELGKNPQIIYKFIFVY